MSDKDTESDIDANSESENNGEDKYLKDNDSDYYDEN